MANKIKQTGSIKSEDHSGKPMLTSDVIQGVQEMVTCDLKSSTQSLSWDLAIPN